MHTCSTTVGDERWTWEVERLWELAAELPVFEAGIAHLTENLFMTNWSHRGDPPMAASVVVSHIRRILGASDHPIILNAEGGLMDGAHRLYKALLDDRKTIKAVQFEITPPPDQKRKRA